MKFKDKKIIYTTIVSSKLKKTTLFLLSCLLFISCGNNSMPLPYGYFRVDLPEHAYKPVSDTFLLPYKFDLSNYAIIERDKTDNHNDWINIYYPKLNAVVYCSYLPVKGNLFQLMEDAHKYVYKHTIKADGIGEKVFGNQEKHVYGILYELDGNTASALQFVLTDSVRHFFRGALYFNNVPNQDSIAPMSAYVREDIMHMIETFEWKK